MDRYRVNEVAERNRIMEEAPKRRWDVEDNQAYVKFLKEMDLKEMAGKMKPLGEKAKRRQVQMMRGGQLDNFLVVRYDGDVKSQVVQRPRK